MSPTYTLLSADFYNLKNLKCSNTISLTKNYNYDGFDIFWTDINRIEETIP